MKEGGFEFADLLLTTVKNQLLGALVGFGDAFNVEQVLDSAAHCGSQPKPQRLVFDELEQPINQRMMVTACDKDATFPGQSSRGKLQPEGLSHNRSYLLICLLAVC
jgi:hypothetical protein